MNATSTRPDAKQAGKVLPNQTRINDAKRVADEKAAKLKDAPAKEPKQPKDDPVLRQTITVKAEKNPKREGTASAARFSLYRTGMVVSAYIAAVKDAKGSARAARADIAWDTKHGFISVA